MTSRRITGHEGVDLLLLQLIQMPEIINFQDFGAVHVSYCSFPGHLLVKDIIWILEQLTATEPGAKEGSQVMTVVVHVLRAKFALSILLF